ncbi:hypothetical protein HETIRDRAFT_165696 [Heterobasidion irregulare TC 32-1]|uniref:Uncharacterized protein n=1 Tax=Heterobasidion irregulare (strain TC 32-1) TaxID=747525 RepID=W4KCF5_HETIT|nr:uncharacterized protein HETIRDRAFT_165696 [Heterobasidion irregulare TC 32-1]ETW83414.1 hypothetical protein HETIRDRAFT_165696 [Heterobasidion irregulare TC 32-1]
MFMQGPPVFPSKGRCASRPPGLQGPLPQRVTASASRGPAKRLDVGTPSRPLVLGTPLESSERASPTHATAKSPLCHPSSPFDSLRRLSIAFVVSNGRLVASMVINPRRVRSREPLMESSA